MTFDDNTINQIWEKGKPLDGLSPEIVRLDPCGALMIRARFGDHSSEFGWDIDHIYPQMKGGDDSIENLRPMQWQNCFAKGNDFPVYFGVMTAQGNNNVPNASQYRITDAIYKKLIEKYEPQH